MRMLGPGPPGSCGGGLGRPFQRRAIPVREPRASFVSALTEVEQRPAGRWRGAHIVIHKKELAELLVIKSCVRADPASRQPLWLGSHVGIEGCPLNITAAGPKPDTANFMRIGFTCNRVGARAFRGRAARESGHGMVEAPPEKVDRTALADETGPELVKNAIHRDKDFPESAHSFGII